MSSSKETNVPVLSIENLSISATDSETGISKEVVKNLNLTLHSREMLALAGESGSGKSVLALAILGLLPKTLRITAGRILFHGNEMTKMDVQEKRRLLGKDISYIFQNYQSSFTPYITIGKQMMEIIHQHNRSTKAYAKEKALEWLNKVKLPADRVFHSYPFQLSGGQLQRASLAAALMLTPSMIIADEPTTALDVITSRQVLDLLRELQMETGCAVLFISHDLSLVFRYTDRMTMMYGGRIVETGPTTKLKHQPEHPYTQLLLKARPVLTGELNERLSIIPGEPGLFSQQGCSFLLRCPYQEDLCLNTPLVTMVGDEHTTACHLRHRRGGVLNGPLVADQSSI